MKNPMASAAVMALLLLFPLCNRVDGISHFEKEKMSFSSGGFEIAGEIIFPDGEGPFPLVIMVHGDGPAYMSYFPKVKESILKAGYATLMWDKPGFGKSRGKFSDKHLRQERADILLDAISAMQKHPQIEDDGIGVWGISQAGYVIPYALQQTEEIKFMILVGVGGENGIRQTAYYIRAQMMCIGIPEKEAMEAEQHFIGLCYADSFDEYYKCAKPLVDDPVQREMGFVTAMWTADEWKPKDPTDEGFFDPISVFEKTKIPALVFFGELDKNVDPIQGMHAYREAFEKAGNSNCKVILVEGTDHNIIISETGCASERYARSGEGWSDYHPEYLMMMEEWLHELKQDKPADEVLNHYRKQSSNTDPGPLSYAYGDLPVSTAKTCKLIKKQLIHPMEASQMKDVLPEGRFYEDADFPTASEMLQELLKRNDAGLIMNRKPEERLVVACHHHGLLLASILRNQGIPVRIRAGFARYFEEKAGVRFGHVVCEVWDEKEQKWLLVDPDRNMVDFPKNKFQFSQDAWMALREKDLDPVRYTSALSEGSHAILHILMQDLSCVVGEEKLYWDEPEFLHATIHDINVLTADELLLLDSIASLLSNPDQNLLLLQKIYDDNHFLHPTGLLFSDWYVLRTGKSIEAFYTEFE
jgi:pimeloyl-ACP methyl ester carboxylesterase